MLQAIEFIATLCASLFAGAALYITLVEHPARMALETETAARQWAPSYQRATWMQAPLAMVSGLASIIAWSMEGEAGWLVAGILIGSVVPFTLLLVMPINHQLLMKGRDLRTSDTRALLERWGTLHAVRTALSMSAVVIDLWLLSQV